MSIGVLSIERVLAHCADKFNHYCPLMGRKEI